jgi:hypothetical protein
MDLRSFKNLIPGFPSALFSSCQRQVPIYMLIWDMVSYLLSLLGDLRRLGHSDLILPIISTANFLILNLFLLFLLGFEVVHPIDMVIYAL